LQLSKWCQCGSFASSAFQTVHASFLFPGIGAGFKYLVALVIALHPTSSFPLISALVQWTFIFPDAIVGHCH